MDESKAIRLSIEIDRPPAEVWPWIEEPGKQMQWMKGVVSNEATSEGPTRVGSTFLMKIKEGRRVSDYEGEITAYDPPRHMAVRLSGGCMPAGSAMTADYVLEDLGGRTRIDYTCGAELKGWFLKVMFGLFKWFARRQAKSFFATLKLKAEAEERPAAAVR